MSAEEQIAWLDEQAEKVAESPEEVVAEEPVEEAPKPKPKKRSTKKTKPELVKVLKARGPRIVRSDGEYITGKEYEVTPEVAEILLGLTSPHGQSYFDRA